MSNMLPTSPLGFWGKLPKPFFALAPMADVTDAAFREIIQKASRHGQPGGGPDVFWTEFVSADGLIRENRDILKRDLLYGEGERPIVAQLFSSNPEHMREAAKLCAEMGFDGIDINMGCPDRTIEKQGAGAAMIKTPDIAAKVIHAAKAGILDAEKTIPVSVKTRVGYASESIDTWIPFLLQQDIAALTVHARTRKELSLVPADWERIARVVRIRDLMGVQTKIIGNGDIADLFDGREKAARSGCDGVMIGRAIFGNPWLFDSERAIISRAKPIHPFLSKIFPSAWVKKLRGEAKYTRSLVTTRDRLAMLAVHAKRFEELLGDVKHFSIMKKHFKAYVHGFPGAKELRVELMEKGDNADAVARILDTYEGIE